MRCHHDPLCEQDHKTPINIRVPIVSGPNKDTNLIGYLCRFCQCVYVPSFSEDARRRASRLAENKEAG